MANNEYYYVAGWSSPVAREAHNLEVVSSNLAPAHFCQGAQTVVRKMRAKCVFPYLITLVTQNRSDL